VGISRDYPLKTRTSKQSMGEIPGYEKIPSHPLKYPRSKQGLRVRLDARRSAPALPERTEFQVILMELIKLSSTNAVR
jgi:hypothetical protein